MVGVIEGMIGAFGRKWPGLDVPPPVKPLPQPGWREDRLSRRPASGKRTTLTAVNDRLSRKGDWLHPTKGVRNISDKRTHAIAIVADIKAGYLSHGNLDEIRRRLKTS